MAKKDLSHAKGLDALFNSSATVVKQEPAHTKPVAKKKSSPPVRKKKVVKPPVETLVAEEDSIQEEIVKETPKATRKKSRSSQQQVFSVNLEGVRKRKIEYTGIRLKKDLFERLEQIAHRERLKSTNSLIALVLEAYCDGYEG